MALLKPFAALLFIFASITMAAQEKGSPLAKGSFNIGYRVITLPYVNASKGSDTINLVLNMWYPTEQKSGTHMHLLDYLHCHKSKEPRESYDSLIVEETEDLKKFVYKNFGHFDAADWKLLEDQTTSAYLNASYSPSPFPVIVGRLRAFSTTYTNEFLASHGYIVCMMNGVEDHPPSNRTLYNNQISNEIEYFDYIRNYLHKSLQIATGKSGLMGFSGGGFSQFFAPMHQDVYDAVALLESGIFLDGDLFDIVSHHPYYAPEKFKAPLLFLYNKNRFENNQASQNFYNLKSENKYLVLFNDPTQHHWDFATEGMAAALYLHNRDKAVADRQIVNFKMMNDIILKFFNSYLKGTHEFNGQKSKPIIINPQNP